MPEPPSPDTVSFAGADGLSWVAEAAEAAWVRGTVAAAPRAVGSLPGAAVVKRNPVRTVWRVPRDGAPAVFVKRFSVGKVLDPVKYLLTASRAAAEWEASRGMRSAGIPAAEVVAMAEARTAGVLRGAMLVVAEVPDTLELVPFLFHRWPGGGPWSGEEARARRAFLLRLGALVRRIHDAGFVHPDLHGGNVLVGAEPGEPSITVIDLHTVRRRASVGPGARESDLAKFLHSLLTATSTADRARILRAYEGGAPSLPPGDPLRRMEGRIAALEARRVRSRTVAARLLRPSGRFDAARSGDLRMVFLRKWGREPFLRALEAHARAAAAGGEALLKKGGRSTVTRVTVDGPGGPVPVVVKETRVRGATDLAKNALVRPRAVRSWLGGNGLWHRNVDVAEPLALLVRGSWPRLRESFLVMEDVAAAGERFDLRTLRLWGEGVPDRASGRAKRRLASRFGSFVGSLHARGIYHGDLKAVNVFLRPKHGRESFCLVDYDRVAFGAGPVGLRRRAKNLAQLAASLGEWFTRADRLRFYRSYAAKVEGAWEERREAARLVAEACARKIVVRRRPIE